MMGEVKETVDWSGITPFLASQSFIIRSSGDWLRLKLLMMGDSEVKERVMLGWTGLALEEEEGVNGGLRPSSHLSIWCV
jgi:hypothetical protein